MSEQPSNGQLGQFLGDLSAIREKRNVSLTALRDATKVYPNVISQFEKDGLKDHPLFNPLYVRAFIRSYAETLDISAEEVLRAYDRALKGKYRRELAIEYLDLPPEEIAALKALQKNEEKAEPVFAADKFEFNSEKKIEEASASGATVTFIAKPKKGDNDSTIVAWIARIKSGVQSFFESGKQNAIIQWVLLAGGIGLGSFVILQLLSFQSGTSTSSTSQPEASNQTLVSGEASINSADSLETLPAEKLEVKMPAVPVILGDSIPIYIVAESGKLDPFRMKKDQDLRRPYWLDEGDSMLVYLKNRLTVEDNLAAINILIEGKSYPIYATDSLARVVINRDSIEAFLEGR